MTENEPTTMAAVPRVDFFTIHKDYTVPILNMALLDVLSLTATVATIGLFLCGIPICRDFASKGHTEGVNAAPFVLGTIGCTFWLRYGLFKDDSTVVMVNATGWILYAAYLALYWFYTRNKTSINRQLMVISGLSVAMLYYMAAYGPLSPDVALNNLGQACVVLNMLGYGAPLAGLGEVLRSKCTATLPLPLCAANLIVSVLWLSYGALVDDIYIKFPNLVGMGLSLVQLSLFLIYPRQRAHRT